MTKLISYEFNGDKKWHYCKAIVDGVTVGVIKWDGINTLHSIAVAEPYRRQGVATGMWHAIEDQYKTVFKSVMTKVSTDGFKFFDTVLDGFDNDIEELPDEWIDRLIAIDRDIINAEDETI